MAQRPAVALVGGDGALRQSDVRLTSSVGAPVVVVGEYTTTLPGTIAVRKWYERRVIGQIANALAAQRRAACPFRATDGYRMKQ